MTLRCCGTTWTEDTATVSVEGPHRVARCPSCRKWLRALPRPNHEVTIPFGKYRDQFIAPLWQTDPAYLTWMLAQPWLKPRLKQVIEALKPSRPGGPHGA